MAVRSDSKKVFLNPEYIKECAEWVFMIQAKSHIDSTVRFMSTNSKLIKLIQ